MTEYDDFDDDYEERPRRPRKKRRVGKHSRADSTGGVIPYNNPSALIAYYCGLFSLFPLLGFFLGVAGFILGIRGLMARNREPEIKGSVHAWIGIIVGGGCALVWGAVMVVILIAVVSGA